MIPLNLRRKVLKHWSATLLGILIILVLLPTLNAQPTLELPPLEQTVRQLLADADFTDTLPDSVIQSFSQADVAYLPDALRVNIHHRETSAMYERLREPVAVAACNSFFNSNRDTLISICGELRVDPAIIMAIWYTESELGENTGSYRVRDLFFTLTLLEEQSVIEWNIAQALVNEPERDPEEAEESIKRRSRSKRNWALRELNTLLLLYPAGRLDLLQGSWAGAVGIPQFLPSSIRGYGIDWNSDGTVNLNEFGDAVASTANYLRSNGWRDTGTVKKQRQAIWNYNHSQPYVDGVMHLYHALKATSVTAD